MILKVRKIIPNATGENKYRVSDIYNWEDAIWGIKASSMINPDRILILDLFDTSMIIQGNGCSQKTIKQLVTNYKKKIDEKLADDESREIWKSKDLYSIDYKISLRCIDGE